MRHWLCVLLLALLPFQFSWAAVTGYCTHESNTQVRHLGHHEHVHGDAAADATADAKANPGDDGRASASIDPDCGHCHGLGVGLLMPWDAVAGPAQVRDGAPSTAPGRLLRVTAPPDRPQWLPLA
jgi:hypothetical protein